MTLLIQENTMTWAKCKSVDTAWYTELSGLHSKVSVIQRIETDFTYQITRSDLRCILEVLLVLFLRFLSLNKSAIIKGNPKIGNTSIIYALHTHLNCVRSINSIYSNDLDFAIANERANIHRTQARTPGCCQGNDLALKLHLALQFPGQENLPIWQQVIEFQHCQQKQNLPFLIHFYQYHKLRLHRMPYLQIDQTPKSDNYCRTSTDTNKHILTWKHEWTGDGLIVRASNLLLT